MCGVSSCRHHSVIVAAHMAAKTLSPRCRTASLGRAFMQLQVVVSGKALTSLRRVLPSLASLHRSVMLPCLGGAMPLAAHQIITPIWWRPDEGQGPNCWRVLPTCYASNTACAEDCLQSAAHRGDVPHPKLMQPDGHRPECSQQAVTFIQGRTDSQCAGSCWPPPARGGLRTRLFARWCPPHCATLFESCTSLKS